MMKKQLRTGQTSRMHRQHVENPAGLVSQETLGHLDKLDSRDELVRWKRALERQHGPGLLVRMNLCDHCHRLGSANTTLSFCSGCKIVRYCNKGCQRRAWPTHKAACRVAARQRQDGTFRMAQPTREQVPIDAALHCLHIDDAMRARHARGE